MGIILSFKSLASRFKTNGFDVNDCEAELILRHWAQVFGNKVI